MIKNCSSKVISSLFCVCLLLCSFDGSAAKTKSYSLKSPSGAIETTINVGELLSYSVKMGDMVILAPSAISMTLEDGRVLGEGTKVRSAKTSSVSNVILSPFYRFSSISEEYNQIEIKYKDGYSVIFRAYDQGVAYRFVTNFKYPFSVTGEGASFHFDKDYTCYIPYSASDPNPFQTSFESRYDIAPISEFKKDKVAFLPLLVSLDHGVKVAITESDLESYPGMFLRGCENGFEGVYAGIPSKVRVDKWRYQEIAEEYSPVLAKAACGNRSFPWRILAIAQKDTELPVNNLVYLLGAPNRIGDVSWIKPGKVAWDWWNGWGVTGVDFRVGINTATYKYFIDFASANGIEYVVLDEGWSPSTTGATCDDILYCTPDIDLKELVTYAKSKNVDLILWAVGFTLDKKLEEACKYYSELGIKGFKVDFMDRDDQQVVEMNYRILDMAAKYHLVIDYHGMYKPTGLNRTYPNLLNYEGVWGLEQMKWSTDDMITYDVTFPYIRMLAGIVDYTPGATRNATKNSFSSIYYNPMSQGTRAHQVAMYVVLDSPLAMLCDNPTSYMKEQETTDYICQIPTAFDETRILAGEIGKYIITARRLGEKWYIGGLNNWDERDVTINLLDILGESNDNTLVTNGVQKAYKASIFSDGINADRHATDYKISDMTIPASKELTIHMAPGGGFAIVLSSL